jgi:uncharacterized protein (TIGR03086 family)
MGQESSRTRYLRAWEVVRAIGASAAPESWEHPSPNPGWTARHVAGHLVDGHRQVRSLVSGAGPRPPVSDAGELAAIAGPDPAAALREAEAAVRAELADLDLDRLVETPLGSLPVGQVLATAVIEPLIHGWDLAQATGQRLELDPELTAAVLPAVEQLGDGLAATGMYASALPVPDDAAPSERLLAALGRRAVNRAAGS